MTSILVGGSQSTAPTSNAHLSDHGLRRFIWSGVLAFDRIGSRIPQLVQISLIELFFALPLAFFIAKIVDIRGGFGVPGTGGSLDGVYWAALAVSLVCGFFFVKSLLRPRLVTSTWTSMVSADIPFGGAPVTIFGGNRAWRVEYTYLTGDNTFYWKVASYVGLIVVGLMAVARLLAWYVFRFGRGQLDAQTHHSPMSRRRLSWEIAWKPVLMRACS